MLAEAVTVDGQESPPGEQSSKARRSASQHLCSFARLVRSDRRGSAEDKPCQGEQQRGMACSRGGGAASG
jgi:hypothetical protein